MKRKYKKFEQIQTMADELASTIVIRTYDENGNSHDVRRKPLSAEEREKLRGIFYMTLVTINRNRDVNEVGYVQGVIDMAEFMIDKLIPYVNGYDSMYLPLKRVVKEWETE